MNESGDIMGMLNVNDSYFLQLWNEIEIEIDQSNQLLFCHKQVHDILHETSETEMIYKMRFK